MFLHSGEFLPSSDTVWANLNQKGTKVRAFWANLGLVFFFLENFLSVEFFEVRDHVEFSDYSETSNDTTTIASDGPMDGGSTKDEHTVFATD